MRFKILAGIVLVMCIAAGIGLVLEKPKSAQEQLAEEVLKERERQRDIDYVKKHGFSEQRVIDQQKMLKK